MENDFLKIKTLNALIDSGSVLILGFEDALVGYSQVKDTIVAVYDQDIFIDILAEDMPFADAIELFHQNFIPNDIGDNTPIFIRLNNNI